MVGTLTARWIRAIETQCNLKKGSLTIGKAWDICLSNNNIVPLSEFIENAKAWDRYYKQHRQ